MGYDMCVIDPAEADVKVKVEAAAEFEKAWKYRDSLPRGSKEAEVAQQQVLFESEESYKADKTYYRLNIWGMGWARQVMYYAAMLKEPVERPEWPNPWPDEDEPGHEEAQAQAAVIKRLHDPDSPGIDPAKFSSNDGWIVTPEECLGAIMAWERLSKDQQLEAIARGRRPSDTSSAEDDHTYFEQWVDFLRYAKDHGGFEVW